MPSRAESILRTDGKGVWIRDPKYKGSRAEDYRVQKKFSWSCNICKTVYTFRGDAENCEYKHEGKIVEQTVEIPVDEKVTSFDFYVTKPMVSCPFNSNLHDHSVSSVKFAQWESYKAENSLYYNYPGKPDPKRPVKATEHAIVWEEVCVPSKKQVLTTAFKQGKRIARDIVGGCLIWEEATISP